MRVIVTGASGFIGRETIGPLQRIGADIHCLGPNAISVPGVQWHCTDLLLTDPGPLLQRIGATHLLHLAWYAVPGKFWSAPENLDWVAASIRLIRCFSAAGGERAVVAGSCAEYDWSHALLEEDQTPLNPATLYGESKASLFRMTSRAAPVLGLSMAWGRVFFPFGPNERGDRLLGSALDAILARRPAQFSEGTQEREFMHVEDTAAALVALLASDVRGAVNIALGQLTSVRALIETAAGLAGMSGLMEFGARPMQPGEPPRLAAKVERLQKEVGFRPHYTLSAGVADALARRQSPRR